MEVVHSGLASEAVFATPATSDPKPRMDAHRNAHTRPHGRQLIVARLAQGWTVSAVALALGVDPKTMRKWRDRFAAEGPAGLADRSPRPHTARTRLEEAAGRRDRPAAP